MARQPDRDASEIVRLHAKLRGGRKPSAREERTERKRKLRQIRDGKKKWAAVRGTPAAEKRPPGSKIISLEELLEYVLTTHQPVPEKAPIGRAGRKAAQAANQERGNKTATRIHRLILKGMTPQQIAKRTGLALSTVYRYWPTEVFT